MFFEERQRGTEKRERECEGDELFKIENNLH